jgi:hypothetical protein
MLNDSDLLNGKDSDSNLNTEERKTPQADDDMLFE